MPLTPPPLSAEDEVWDVVVIGAGINGVATAGALAEAGCRVLVVDRGDLGSGTSQASTMLVWGGLLYLKDWELRTVLALCRERDRLIATAPDRVEVCEVRYVPTPGGRPRALVLAALQAYWALAAGRRRPARRLTSYSERALLQPDHGDAYSFDEGGVRESDARFVLATAQRAVRCGATVRTYQRVDACRFSRMTATWAIDLTDTLTAATTTVRARAVVNAAGPWADAVNAAAGVETPYRHVLSRGVSISLPRDSRHDAHLVFDTDDGNTLTLAPWGPVALWASTESLHPDVESARRIDAHDVAYLLDHYNARFRTRQDVGDIVSLRVGVRPVAVARDQVVDRRGLGLSRHHKLHLDQSAPWLTIFGGKLSGCDGLAREVCTRLMPRLRATRRGGPPRHGDTPAAGAIPTATFPGLPGAIVAPTWSVRHEYCRTLEDYVRRRTNIAQWVPAGGFGRHDEHTAAMRSIALALHEGDDATATRDLQRWRAQVDAERRVLDATLPHQRRATSGALA